ncbi:MAG: hypothetical protein CMF60_01510 [Magnetococcales bacterium]|nr:hypothetical protein [Magnetococcales bacterium]MEC8067340.1 hypothetical protein [Pseudomonadota bacterium]
MIRCTFSDALKVREDPSTRNVFVLFNHGFRVKIDVHIAKTTQNKIGWRINMHGNSEVIRATKKELFDHTIHYLEKRLRKPLAKITFEDIILLTQAKPIKSVTRSEG